MDENRRKQRISFVLNTQKLEKFIVIQQIKHCLFRHIKTGLL